jgi:hypothetical protein
VGESDRRCAIHEWLKGNYALVVKRDRGEPLVVFASVGIY